jgi:hypothetical protein
MQVTHADAAILSAIEADLLRPEVIEAALTTAITEIQKPANHEDRRAASWPAAR